MKVKGFAAIALVFAVLFSLCACRTVGGKTYKIDVAEDENGEVITDSDGAPVEVLTRVNEDTGETIYYYKDDEGFEITVPSGQVKQSEVASTASKTTAAAGDIEEYMEAFTDPANFEENDAELVIAEDPIDTEDMTEVQVEVDSDGNPAHGTQQEYLEQATESKQYTIKMTMKTISSDGTTVTTDMTVMQDGDKMFIDTALPVDDGSTLRMCMLIKDQSCVMYMPKMKMKMTVPSESLQQVKEALSSIETDENAEYDTSGKITVNGKTYDVDIYHDGTTTLKYYYLNGALKRYESIEEDGTTTIIEYNEIVQSVDSSKFTVPSGYIDISSYMDSDELDNVNI